MGRWINSGSGIPVYTNEFLECQFAGAKRDPHGRISGHSN